MQDLTLPQLKAACQESGLSPYGNREELLERLNAAAKAELVDAPGVLEPVIGADEADGLAMEAEAAPDAIKTISSPLKASVIVPVNETGAKQPGTALQGKGQASPLLLASSDDAQFYASRPQVAVDAVKEIVENINRKYGHIMKAVYNPAHETLDFTGGLQGPWCTSVHQSAANILDRKGITGAADEYARIAREALMHARNPANALGSVSGMN